MRDPDFVTYLRRVGPRHGSAIAEDLKCGTDVDVRAIVADLREAGYPICSDTHRGYWVTDDPLVLQQTADSLRRRAVKIFRSARALERAIATWCEGKQIELEIGNTLKAIMEVEEYGN